MTRARSGRGGRRRVSGDRSGGVSVVCVKGGWEVVHAYGKSFEMTESEEGEGDNVSQCPRF
jgi:hypothetical protein